MPILNSVFQLVVFQDRRFNVKLFQYFGVFWFRRIIGLGGVEILALLFSCTFPLSRRFYLYLLILPCL